MQEEIAGCFSSAEKTGDVDPTAATKSGHNVFVSAYVANLADHRRLITVTWCKNLLVHGLSVTVSGSDEYHTCKVEIKPWHFWKKQGSKRFLLDRSAKNPVDVFWDLRVAKFNGEAEPASDYYVAVVSDGEVALLLGNMKDEAYRKTGCRPALVDPVLVWRKEHVFGKRRFGTRARFHDKGGLHEISISINGGGSDDHEMEIRIDGHVVVHVRHLQWKFRGNECVRLSRGRIEVYYDVHDWLFLPPAGGGGQSLRHALFIFKPTLLLSNSSSPLSGSSSEGRPEATPEFCLFLYAWKLE